MFRLIAGHSLARLESNSARGGLGFGVWAGRMPLWGLRELESPDGYVCERHILWGLKTVKGLGSRVDFIFGQCAQP